MSQFIRISLGITAIALSAAALADKPVIYPAKGQSAAQQQKDDGECYTWAKGNTGIDPAALAAAPPPAAAPTQASAPAPGGQRIKGAAKGAIVGGLVSGGEDTGAKSGAVVGMMAGGAKARQQQAAQQKQAPPQAQTSSQQQMGTFYRAYGACMEGRGYTVK